MGRFRLALLVGFALVILLLAVIRWRLREMPLERDEGEYAYAGQLILQSVPPYQIAYNMKLPGTYVMYAAMMTILGQTVGGIRLGLLAANTLTILLLYLIGRRLYGTLAGVVAGTSYGLLSVGPWVNGFAGHATHFVVLFAMAGLWLLLVALEKKRVGMILCAGILLGLAFVMKQPGAVFGLFAALYLLIARDGQTPWPQKFVRLGWLAAGGAFPFALTCLVLWRMGVFDKFWFWTFSYASQYATNVGLAEGWKFLVTNFSKIFSSAIGIWVLAAVGLSTFLWNSKAKAHAGFIVGLLLFSGLGVSAGLYFRAHYFILLLPAISLLAGLAVSSVADLFDPGEVNTLLRSSVAAVYLVIFVVSLLGQEYFFFEADPVSASRYVYPADPFPEAAEVGIYIEQNSSASDCIAVLGSEPQLMFYSKRRSATGYLYAYPLTENQPYASTMQHEVISEIEAARPQFVVFVQDWVVGPDSDTGILRWSRQYLDQNYEFVGAMRVDDGLHLRSRSELAQTPGGMTGALLVYKRRAQP